MNETRYPEIYRSLVFTAEQCREEGLEVAEAAALFLRFAWLLVAENSDEQVATRWLQRMGEVAGDAPERGGGQSRNTTIN
ncbi:MAG: hypothetical protein JJT85_09495 [Chromatiales bacterium]|nr:hypothetical protein [Chromatiales bacterium]